MKKTIVDFRKAICRDRELDEKIQNLSFGVKAFIDLGKEYGFEFTGDELKNACDEMGKLDNDDIWDPGDDDSEEDWSDGMFWTVFESNWVPEAGALMAWEPDPPNCKKTVSVNRARC